MPNRISYTGLILVIAIFSIGGAFAQTRKPKNIRKTPPKPVPAATPSTPVLVAPHKKNERPTTPGSGPAAKTEPLVYRYLFERAGFTFPRVEIAHDEAGKGTVTFEKDGFDEPIADPVDLSAVTLEGLKKAFAALNFLDSVEEYQYAARDYSHLGNVTVTMTKPGRTRSVKYNWTENKEAKFLMDEYRRIGNEYTWRFEMTSARENQPLLTPRLMDAIDGYLKRRDISDPPHLVPFLTQLSNDERLPLIARNHAARLIKQIEKKK